MGKWERGELEGKERRERRKGAGEGLCPQCLCAVWWCEVLNGGLCRITLVACCISDVTGSVAALTDVTAAAATP